MSEARARQAFVLRLNPGGVNALAEALKANEVIIGWSDAEGLLKTKDWERFRERIKKAYHPDEPNYRKAGAAASPLWAFLHVMAAGDLIVVPDGGQFFVAEVTGEAYHDAKRVEDDRAHRRPVRWLNERKPIPRDAAPAALRARMKIQGTLAYAEDLIGEIQRCLDESAAASVPGAKARSLHGDLRERLIAATVQELRTGKIDDRRFEELIRRVLLATGASRAEIIPRQLDRGVDVKATWMVAGVAPVVVGVQAKHWQPTPPVGPAVVEQLVKGMVAEGISVGFVMTTGEISEKAEAAARSAAEEHAGFQIHLVDGDDFAALIVDAGLRVIS